MNGHGKFMGCVAVVIVIGGAFFYLTQQEGRIADAQAKAEKAEETARHLTELETERVWGRLDHAVQDLEGELDEPKKKEVVKRLKQEIQRVKGRFRYDQLGK